MMKVFGCFWYCVVIHHLVYVGTTSIYVEGEHSATLECSVGTSVHSTYPISPCESMRVYGIAKNNISFPCLATLFEQKYICQIYGSFQPSPPKKKTTGNKTENKKSNLLKNVKSAQNHSGFFIDVPFFFQVSKEKCFSHFFGNSPSPAPCFPGCFPGPQRGHFSISQCSPGLLVEEQRL